MTRALRPRGATRAAVVLGALVCAAAPSARAELPEMPTAAPGPALQWTRWLQIGAQIDVADQPDPVMRQVYKRGTPFAVRMHANVLFEERYGVGLSAGVQRRAGLGVSPEGDPPSMVLWQVPIAVEGWLRLALWRDQPVVPYLRAGVDLVVAIERFAPLADDAVDEDTEGAEPAADDDPAPATLPPAWVGVKGGVHGGGGVQIRLPFPEAQWDGGMVGPPGVRDVYLHIEGWARSADNFGQAGVNLSAVGVSAGVTVLL